MIPIPFTKIRISWHLPALLVLFLLISSSWQRGLVSFVLLVGGIWLIGYVGGILVVFFCDAKRRRPDESFRQLSSRVSHELAQRSASRGDNRYHSSYQYLTLDCGHVLMKFFPSDVPQAGETF